MKDQIISIVNCNCTDAEKFNKLFPLYNQHPNRNQGLAKTYNAHGVKYLPNLIYELKKLHQIKDIDIHLASLNSGPCTNCGRKLDSLGTTEGTTFSLENELQNNSQEAFTNQGTEVSNEEKEENSEPKLREDYPFLNDIDCPEEFKILAADKITTYNLLKEAQSKLQDVADGKVELQHEEIQDLTKQAQDADELNSLIHQEFEHFKETGKVLGKHSIFSKRMLMEKIEAMTGEEKVKRIKSLEKDIKREKSNIEKLNPEIEEEASKIEKIKQRLEVKNLELDLVKKSVK